jgi:hypothetical protein
MDVHLTQMSQHLEDVEDCQEAQAANLEKGHCCCGTLVESVPVTQSPGLIFEGFEGPQSGAVTDSHDEVLPVVTVEEMRVWATSRESKPKAGPSSSEAEALDWVERYLMHPLSPGWDEEDIEALLAAFPELL